MSYIWLILKLLPFLFVTAAYFYRLGKKSVQGEVARIARDKGAVIEHEQRRTDESVKLLKEKEDQLAALAEQYEHLERSAVPRRKLNEVEARNNFLEKELAKYQNSPAPAPVQVRPVIPAAPPAPEPPKPEPKPEPPVAVVPPAPDPVAEPEPETETEPEPENLSLTPEPELVTRSKEKAAKKTKRRR